MVGVAGCLAQQWGTGFTEKVPFLDLVIGTHNIHLLPEMIREKDRSGRPVVETSLRECVESIGILTLPGKGVVSAFVTIMQGCNNFCAYCVVPYLRGREESRDIDAIIDEIRYLADNGIREVTLLGQNVNAYGITSGKGRDFAFLLREIGKIKGIDRIRFTTSHPKDLSEDIINSFAEVRQLCEHIHLPVQSGSDTVLRRMNRRYTVADYLKKVDKLRKICSNISVTSDIIVGFPGESDADFQRTLQLMEEVRFDSVFSFNYSDRHGTVASEFDDKIGDEEKSARLVVLQKLQEKHTLERNERLVGGSEEVLVEGHSRNSDHDMTGRTRTNKIVNFAGGIELIGTTVPVKIEKAFLHSLRGKLRRQKEVSL